MAMNREHEIHQRRKGRNVGVLAALAALAVLLFAVTLVKLGPAGSVNPTAGKSWGDTLMEWVMR